MPKILVVEDNEMNSESLTRRLTKRGFEVVVATDGRQGLAMAVSERPDLILMDLGLPIIDGWEVTRRLKASPKTRKIPVIALTAHAMVEERERALAVGCDDYDTKPIRLPRLMSKVESLLEITGSSLETWLQAQDLTSTPEAGETSVSSRPAKPVPTGSGASLLLVDDDEVNRDAISRRLIKEGYGVTTVASGREALKQIRESHYDLVLLDVMMPEMSGYEVLVELRQQFSPLQLPVIMVTARDQDEDVVRALQLGANDYITKPINYPVATARIESHLTLATSARQSAPPALDSGPEMLAGRYRILETLGAGGFSHTYLAQDTQRPGLPSCVVKQLRSANSDPESLALARRLFQREAQTLEALKHPQIPQLLAYFEQSHEFYLVQEYIEGSLLTEELGYKPISEPRAVSVLWDLLPVLDYLHQRQVIHRDIKPHNIIRRKSTRRLVLIDFGTVKDISGLAPSNPMTVAIGTLGYAPVEQCAGHPRLNSDLYALGMVAVQGVTGFAPGRLLQERQATGEINWQQYSSVTPEFAKILDKMIHPNWTQRYQSAHEVIQDLRPIVAQWRVRKAEQAKQLAR